MFSELLNQFIHLVNLLHLLPIRLIHSDQISILQRNQQQRILSLLAQLFQASLILYLLPIKHLLSSVVNVYLDRPVSYYIVLPVLLHIEFIFDMSRQYDVETIAQIVNSMALLNHDNLNQEKQFFVLFLDFLLVELPLVCLVDCFVACRTISS